MKAFIILTLLCPFLQGCVGGVITKSKTNAINDPVILNSWTKELYSESFTAYIHQRALYDASDKIVYTSEWLQKYWGHPDRISRNSANSDEIWTYKSDLIWEGVVPFAIIPIPLILPVTHEKVCLKLHDGHVVNASVTKRSMVGGTYGFIPNPNGGVVFGVWNWNGYYSSE